MNSTTTWRKIIKFEIINSMIARLITEEDKFFSSCSSVKNSFPKYLIFLILDKFDIYNSAIDYFKNVQINRYYSYGLSDKNNLIHTTVVKFDVNMHHLCYFLFKDKIYEYNPFNVLRFEIIFKSLLSTDSKYFYKNITIKIYLKHITRFGWSGEPRHMHQRFSFDFRLYCDDRDYESWAYFIFRDMIKQFDFETEDFYKNDPDFIFKTEIE